MSALAHRHDTEHRYLAGIVGGRSKGGRTVARHAYRLGAAWLPDDNLYIITLIEDVPGIGITFEANSFEDAFERALAISEDMADVSGHLEDGVSVSVQEVDRLSDIGIDEN